ncbi:outer membrane lipoprotein carrier protein LolA [Photobacterium japonica]|uniref:outer membrane lipoprotein carrier protein LolA n=1 Tax=Photobacterium japonica TaxID=2910235 RepID=UPI003D0D835D
MNKRNVFVILHQRLLVGLCLVVCGLSGSAYAQVGTHADTQGGKHDQANAQAQHSAFTLADLQQQLAAQTVVRGDFTQTRHMAMFSAPLQSSGHFLLAQDHGLLWQQTVPFPVSLVLTQDKLSQQFGDSPAQVIAAKDNPMVFYFSHLFLSLFKGDTQQLTEQFTVSLTQPASPESGESAGAQWALTLTPTAAPLNAVFQHIRLSGGQFIDQLVLTEKRGDVTEIQFSHQRAVSATSGKTATTLTKEEQRAFQL